MRGDRASDRGHRKKKAEALELEPEPALGSSKSLENKGDKGEPGREA